MSIKKDFVESLMEFVHKYSTRGAGVVAGEATTPAVRELLLARELPEFGDRCLGAAVLPHRVEDRLLPWRSCFQVHRAFHAADAVRSTNLEGQAPLTFTDRTVPHDHCCHRTLRSAISRNISISLITTLVKYKIMLFKFGYCRCRLRD